MLESFFYPFANIRDKVPGYPVSLIKGGLRAVGRDPGNVRPPLSAATDKHIEELAAVIEASRLAAAA